MGTSWPAIRSDCILRVTTALTTTSPRAEDTRVKSPDLMPSFAAREGGSSTVGSGAISFSEGMLRVVDPAHQCSAGDDVMRTYGKSFEVPIGCFDLIRGYFSIRLFWVHGWRRFATGLSTGSQDSGKGPPFGT